METLLIYLLKAAGYLSLFYLVYAILLSRETSLGLNRIFLSGGIVASFLLPLVRLTRTLPVAKSPVTAVPVADAVSSPPPPLEFLGIWEVLTLIYLIGMAFFLIRFLLQLRNLHLLMKRGAPRTYETYKIVELREDITPFSFFRKVVLNPDLHSKTELEAILRHEQAHIQGKHSADHLIAHLACILLWFNPISWSYRKAVIQNLEYIADRAALGPQLSKREYQKILVQVTVGIPLPVPANHFYQSLIKKRIIMLNKKSHSSAGFWKAGAILPLILAFLFCFQYETRAQVQNQNVEMSKDRDQAISATITPEASEDDLEDLSARFASQGIKLEFDNVSFNDGLITSITAKAKSSRTGSQVTFVQSGDDKINPFTFYLDHKGQMGFSSHPTSQVIHLGKGEATSIHFVDSIAPQSGEAITVVGRPAPVTAQGKTAITIVRADTTAAKTKVVSFSNGETSPLIVVDGDPKAAGFDVESIPVSNIASINVIKGPEAVEKYGTRARGGVIEINLKEE